MKVDYPDNHAVTVGVLFFNRVRQTIDCLRSLLNAPVDIYVFNDGSHPAGREEIGRFCEFHSNIRIIDSRENMGISHGRNALIEEAPTPWLFFVDNDTRMITANWFEILTRHIVHSQGVEVFVPRVFDANENVYLENSVCEIKDRQVSFQKADSDYTNLFPGTAFVVHRDVFARLGSFDPKIFAGFEDFELAIRGILRDQPVVVQYLHDLELVHEHQPQSTEADLETVHIRYDVKRITDHYEWIALKHGVYLDRNFEPWLKKQIEQQTKGTRRSILGKFLDFFRKKLGLSTNRV